MDYFEAALLLLALSLFSLAGVGIFLFAIDRLMRRPKDQPALLALAGGALGIAVGVSTFFCWHYPRISNPSENINWLIALWGFAGLGWGGINTLIATPFIKSPPREWMGRNAFRM